VLPGGRGHCLVIVPAGAGFHGVGGWGEAALGDGGGMTAEKTARHVECSVLIANQPMG
jgi:hypothetical protein